MAIPSKTAVEEALVDLTEAINSYSESPDTMGHISRVEIIARAKDLIRSVVPPKMIPNYHDYHGLNFCIHILIRLAVVMSADSRILNCEMVLPARVGEADFPAAVMDQAVMTMGGKKHRKEGFS
ncbi:hypothetical protein HJFPF1_03341 [Paramyrothecium foliicola]|nr:hypothetical protein HJFPF1_03341 [Paramyrothecium foliicola]